MSALLYPTSLLIARITELVGQLEKKFGSGFSEAGSTGFSEAGSDAGASSGALDGLVGEGLDGSDSSIRRVSQAHVNRANVAQDVLSMESGNAATDAATDAVVEGSEAAAGAAEMGVKAGASWPDVSAMQVGIFLKVVWKKKLELCKARGYHRDATKGTKQYPQDRENCGNLDTETAPYLAISKLEPLLEQLQSKSGLALCKQTLSINEVVGDPE